MIELKGKYNTAKVFTNNIEQTAMSQIIELCNQKFTKDNIIRIMPDVHAGCGCTIGTTMTIKDKIVPNLVGVDIGCGINVSNLGNINIDLKELDEFIRNNIPSGQEIRKSSHKYLNKTQINELKCKNFININRAELSIGTLGGGNHFIELDKDNENNLYLVIHSGSRYLGKQVAEYYQNKAIDYINNNKKDRIKLIAKLKAQGRENEISYKLAELKNNEVKISKDLCYVEGELFDDYIHDMKICQEYSDINKEAMKIDILNFLNINPIETFTTRHNYIDTDNMILRKGSVSAKKEEKLIIPMNMRDGSLICIGKGNKDWNCSAPHGAGRIMSRSKAKENIKLEDFENSMIGIYTTSVNSSTIDESPMVYKPMNEIIDNIRDTVDIINVIKPIYNFKASD